MTATSEQRQVLEKWQRTKSLDMNSIPVLIDVLQARADEAAALLEQFCQTVGTNDVTLILKEARAWLETRRDGTLDRPVVDPLVEALEAVEHLRFLQDHLCTNPLSTEAFIKTFAELVDEKIAPILTVARTRKASKP